MQKRIKHFNKGFRILADLMLRCDKLSAELSHRLKNFTDRYYIEIEKKVEKSLGKVAFFLGGCAKITFLRGARIIGILVVEKNQGIRERKEEE